MKTLRISRSLDKEAFEQELGKLRPPILDAHFRLRGTGSSVVVIVGGADGSGKGEIVRGLSEWLDPRGVETHVFERPDEPLGGRAPYSRIWQALPARGRVGVLFGSWHGAALLHRLAGGCDAGEYDELLGRIRRFEEMLVADGVVFLKLWLHLSKKELKRRVKDLSKSPERHMRFLPIAWKHLKRHGDLLEAADTMLRGTDSQQAPWHIIDADDDRARNLAVARLLLATLRKAGPRKGAAQATAGAKEAKAAGGAKAGRERGKDPLEGWKPRPGGVLAAVDLAQKLDEDEYQEKLDKYRDRIAKLSWKLFDRRRSALLLFEGWDAAGKGGAIRRVTQALDPRLYRVVGFAAPTAEEKAHHYLWRFWRNLPAPGTIMIHDRTHYGRVLVERVEGFAREAEWSRAYGEIVDFEEQLHDQGVVVCKFWLHVSPDEQIRRFRARERVAFKRYKITEEDWRNRARWPLYEDAVEEMAARTSTEHAPWTIVAANDKPFARIEVLRTICRRLADAMERK